MVNPHKKDRKFEKPELAQVEELTIRLAKAHKKLKEEEQKRTEMLSNISHDLRAPLTALRSSIDYLNSFNDSQMPEPEELHSLIHLMDIRTATLENLIQDLFYLTSLDNTQKAYHFETIDLIPFLEEYYFSTESDNKYAKRNLALDIVEGLSADVSIDPIRMTRVMDNLFTNALKYSKENDSITLHAQVNQNSVIVCIEDSGIGIPKDSLDKIFTRSYTVSSSRTPNSVSGSGLGLAIVQHIIDSHNGKVWCESELGKGSRFYFKIPLKQTVNQE